MASSGDCRRRRRAGCPACRPGLGTGPRLPPARGRAGIRRQRRRRFAAIQEIRPRRRLAARPAFDGAKPCPQGGLRLLVPVERSANVRPSQRPDRAHGAQPRGAGAQTHGTVRRGQLQPRPRTHPRLARCQQLPRRRGRRARAAPRRPQPVRTAVRQRRKRGPAHGRARTPAIRAAAIRAAVIRAVWAPARRGASAPSQCHAHPQPERRSLGPRPGRRIRHDVRAHLRRLLFPDVAQFVVGRFRPRPEELRNPPAPAPRCSSIIRAPSATSRRP